MKEIIFVALTCIFCACNNDSSKNDENPTEPLSSEESNQIETLKSELANGVTIHHLLKQQSGFHVLF